MAITKEDAKKTYKFPKTVGLCLARLAKLQDEADVIVAKLKPLTEEEAALREHMIATFKKDNLNGARGSGRALTITKSEVPVINDWESFYKFAKRKGNDDLLQHSVKTDAWRERIQAGKTVPGVETFTRIGLRVNKI